jgi:transposase
MQHITGIIKWVFEFRRPDFSKQSVRFVDAFVDALSLVALGFKIQTLKTEGRPSFDTKVFLKIYLYGYLNGLRKL